MDNVVNTLKSDIEKGLIDPKIPIYTDEDGIINKMVEVTDVLIPSYKQCHKCELNKTCTRVQLDKNKRPIAVDCVIDKELLAVLLFRLHNDGVTSQDEILVLPLIQNLFRMRRFYELENLTDLRRVLNDENGLKMYNQKIGIVKKSEDQMIKIMKELMATRKEDKSNVIKQIKAKDDFSQILSGKLKKQIEEKKKNADEN